MSNEDRLFGQILDALRQSEARYRHLIEHATDIIFTITVDGQLITVNKVAESLFGYAREEFIGKSIFELVAPEDRALARQMIADKLSGGQSATIYTVDIVTRTGQRVPLEISTQVIYDGGLPLAIQGIARNISERLRASAALSEREYFYRTIIERSADILALLDTKASIRYVTPSIQMGLGYRAEDMVGRSALEFIHPDDMERARRMLIRATEAGPESFSEELRVQDAGGEYHTLHVHVRNLIADPIIRGIVIDARDITDRKRTEQALRASEDRFRKLIETSGEGIAIRDANGNISFANERFAQLLGYQVGDVLGWPIERVVAPSSHGILRESFARRRRTGMAESIDLQLLHRDGHFIDVILAASPLYDEAGKFMGALGMVTDVTERKRLEAQLRQSQKMEAVGRLAGGVAHDFNNLLTAIRGNVELMLAEIPPNSSLHGDCEEIGRAADRAAILTQQLLAFSRRQMLQPVVLELDSVVRDLDMLLRRLLTADIELIMSLNAGGGRVRADRSQVEQVLINLVVNARDAMATGGTLQIGTAFVTLDEAFARDNPGALAGEFIKLWVRDTGRGMDAHTLSQVFEPFFTTKEIGHGAGLGLSTVYGIVKQSEGYIRALSQPGQGSSFEVFLPRVQAPVQDRRDLGGAHQNGVHGETILVAEDEDAVRALTCRILRKRGYHVLEARDGREALDIARDFEGDINLVVTDVIMPRVGGRELSEGVSRMIPSVKVLFMSGYTDDQLLQRGVLQSGIGNFLEKPFTPEALARKVREVLESD
ncbi:MAG TPA: PAS domain S-box protein [Longimicrobiales bacterium]